MAMRSLRHNRIALAAGLALVLGAAACGGDEVGPGEWTLEDLQGTWIITRFEFTADPPDDEVFDAIDNGQTATIVIDGNGNYTLTRTVQGLPPNVETGTFSIDGSGNVIDSNEPGIVDIRRDGDTITVRDESVTFDFDNDQLTAETGADLLMEWEKQ
jgi:hypothetical protein